MIEIRHLTKKYGENIAVNDLNLVLEPGNIYGFLGPNGAGKSTTMNIITGYIGASSGEVIINGHDINKEPEKAKQCIGYLPELPPVYGDMKVLEYLKFAADLKQLNKHSRMADIAQVMDLTKLHPVKDRLIRNLSKGYRQRVGLAQALMGLPEIIILDEPTVGLDPKQIIEIRDLIKSLKEEHTVILSSHILQEISAVCDHVFIISKGELVASDSMEHLEAQMSGAQELNLTVKATEDQIQGLEKMDGVKSCEILKIQNLTADKIKTEEEQADFIEAAELAEKVEFAEAIELTEEAESAEAIELTEKVGSAEAIELTEEAELAEATEEAEITEATEFTEKAEDIELSEEMEFAGETEISEKTEIRLKLTAKPDTDIREAVFRYCAENDMILLEMKAVTKSLEDVFLELTDGREVR